MVVVVVVVIRDMQKRISEVEMVQREGRNWRTVATEQRMRRLVRGARAPPLRFSFLQWRRQLVGEGKSVGKGFRGRRVSTDGGLFSQIKEMPNARG
ncbi:unnamed protein product [Linum trigynum]|uniref:Uncharacterized protein n=1 Tax=Linum trigynum TaxID=586398 RepID=A0AAV2E3Y5_9ROSI